MPKLMNPDFEAPLREQIAKVLYEEDAWPDRDWFELNKERREWWLVDADRVIAVLRAVEPKTIADALALPPSSRDTPTVDRGTEA
jgi:hypothetical protein